MSDDMADSVRELMEEYALGLLDGAERAAFEAALASDPLLRQELAATRETLADLGFSTPVAPSADVKSRLMARIAAGVQPAIAAASQPSIIPLPVHRSRAPIWLFAALAAALVLIAKLSLDLRGAQVDIAASQQTATASQLLLAQRDSLLAVLTDPSVQLVTMAAQGPVRPAMKVYLSGSRRLAVIAGSALEALPAGQAYQLWFIVDGKPVPSVTFHPDSAGKALVRDIPMPAGPVAATAITREPDSGSRVPTSPILFVGKSTTE